MAKFDYRSLKERKRKKLVDRLADAFIDVKNKRDMRVLVEQLFTPSEVVMLGRRIEIARRLIRGRTYAEVRGELKVGFSTIRSVDSWLENGVPDYHKLRERFRTWGYKPLKKKSRRRGREGDIFGSFDDIRHRYAGHFLLLNLLLDPEDD